MNSSFAHGHISADSWRSDTAAYLLEGSFDLLVAATSWDSRCLCITQSKDLRAKVAVVFKFSMRDESGLRESHDKKVEQHLSSIASKFHVVSGDSANVKTLWDQLWNIVVGLRHELSRPLRVFIDLSTCPRYYSLGLLGMGTRLGYVSDATIFYAEGKYEVDISSQPVAEEIFTSGKWKTEKIRGLDGAWSPSSQSLYVASIGFEGAKTLQVVAGLDPDRVAILASDGSGSSEYSDRALAANRELINQYNIRGRMVLRAPRGDAIKAWQVLTDAQIEKPQTENVFYLCAGPKPHSVALVLRALATEYPTVLYNLATKHRVVRTIPNGIYWRYRITDRSALR